jgi:hypothetical protein
MANYRAISSGVWSDLARWQDDSLGYFANSTVLPTTDDNVYANNFTVTIDGTRNAFTIRNTAFTPPTNLGAMSIPQMSSNTTPSGAAIASAQQSAGVAAWNAFDRNTGTAWNPGTANTGWLGYQFTSGKVIKRYGFFSHTTNTQSPRTWTFEGSNNGSTWVVLDTQTNFVTSVSIFYSFDISANTTSYTYYRINVTAVQTLGNFVVIPELEMSEVTNLYGGIVAGGGFTFANGGNLTCSAPTNSVFNRAVGSVYCLTFDLPSGQSATFNGSVNEVPNISNGRSILIQNTGTFNMVGDYDINANANNFRYSLFINGSTTINLVGNINNSHNTSSGIVNTLFINAGNPVFNITGQISGGNTNTGGQNGNAIYFSTSTTVNLTGNIVTNSSVTLFFPTSSTLNLVGNVTGGTSFPAILNITSPMTIDILGETTSGSGSPAVSGLATTFVKVRGSVINTDTYNAIYAGRVTIDDNLTFWQYKDSTNTINRTLYASGVSIGNPAEDDVREGVDYGPSLELTGTLAVPTPDNVRKGVPVDATIGTADLTAADMWNYLASNITTSGSIGEVVKNIKTKTDLIPNNPTSNESVGAIVASYNI